MKEKLPLLSSSNKAVRIVGYVLYALVALTVLGTLTGGNDPAGDTGRVSENAVKNAVFPWGDSDFEIFNDTVTVSVDITDPEDRDIAYPYLYEHLFAVPGVEKVMIAGYTKDDQDNKDYRDSYREIRSRAEWEELGGR